MYPTRPGFVAGSDTSEDAADSISDDVLGRMRRRIYREVAYSPAGRTCDEIEVILGLSHQTASARLRELELTGWVEPTPQKRRTRSGRLAHVYRVVF
jgi:predicted ArsR family transcriptional regulator